MKKTRLILVEKAPKYRDIYSPRVGSWAAWGLVAPKWWNRVNQEWNKLEHNQSDVMEPFHRSGVAIMWRHRPP